MNSSKMFWGSFLITIGLLFILVKHHFINSSFDFVWNIWPLIFVFWGIQIIFKQNFIKSIVNAIFGFFIALLVYGMIHSLFWGFNFTEEKSDFFTEQFSKEFEPNVKIVNLSLESGVGTFIIKDSTNNLIDAKSSGIFGNYDYNYSKDSSVVYLDINMEGKNFHFIKNKIKNQLELKLNTTPVWNFRINVGASKNIFDLSQYKVNDLTIETGASNSKIKLGDKSDETNVDIEMGVSKLILEIPKNVGCTVDSDLSLVSKHFDGFNKKEDGIYQTENFDSSKKKIFINVQGGVSSLKILRY